MSFTSTQQAPESSTQPETSPQITPRRRLEDLGLVMLVGFAPLVTSAIYLLLVPVKFNSGYINHRFSAGLVTEIAVLILFLFLLRRQGRGLNTIGLTFQWKDLPIGVGLGLFSYLAAYLFNWSAQLAYYSRKHAFFQYRDSESIFASASFALFAAYTIAAPWFEETLVRGYLMTELIDVSCPVWLATLISIVLQTSYHLYYGFAGALFVGCSFAVSAIYFARFRRLMPVIVSHLLWDLTALYARWHR